MDASIDSSVLGHAPLFAGVPVGELNEVAAYAVRCTAGETLFGQDDPGDAFFVLITGRIKIAHVTAEGHQVVLRYIGPGEVFGAVPLFTNTGYPAASIAVTDSMALRWDRATTHRLLHRYPTIVSNALTIIGHRLHELQNRYRELATERVEQRVGRAILRLLEKAGHREESRVQIAFPLSRQDIAEMTGTTLHTVRRILSEWEKRGVIQSGRMRVIIRDPAALARIADDMPAVVAGDR